METESGRVSRRVWRIEVDQEGGGGIAFSQVRRETRRRFNPSDVRPLASTEEDLEAYEPEPARRELPKVDMPLPVLAGAVLLVIGLALLVVVVVMGA